MIINSFQRGAVLLHNFSSEICEYKLILSLYRSWESASHIFQSQVGGAKVRNAHITVKKVCKLGVSQKERI